MDRREAIQRTAMVLGYAVTGPALAGILDGCKASPELTYTPDFFTEDQARLVSELSEIILPRTSTPGAKDVGVPGFIDSMLKGVYPKEDQDKFVKGLKDFDDDAKTSFGKAFVDCSGEDRSSMVKKHHDAALTKGAQEGDRPFILKVKELTLLGFFTSEPGATQVLQYNQVPGPYKGCVPLTEVGKAWAS